MKPLYPPGTSLDVKMVFNFRLKVKRMLASKAGDIDSQTITEEEETALFSTTELEQESPAFLTETFAGIAESGSSSRPINRIRNRVLVEISGAAVNSPNRSVDAVRSYTVLQSSSAS
jgi:hypothetical protein